MSSATKAAVAAGPFYPSGFPALERNDFGNNNYCRTGPAVLQCYLKCSAETGHHGLENDYYHFLMRRESGSENQQLQSVHILFSLVAIFFPS